MSDDNDVTRSPAASRRALLLGVGAVGATTALAACGTGDGNDLGGSGSPGGANSDTPTGANSGTPAGGGGESGSALAKTDEIPVGGGKIFAEQGVVVTQPSAGQFKAFGTICTHQGCPVSSIDAGTINCTCHGSKFSIEDGSVKAGPARRPLTARQINVEGDSITLA